MSDSPQEERTSAAPGWMVGNVRISIFSDQIQNVSRASWEQVVGTRPAVVARNNQAGTGQEFGTLSDKPFVQVFITDDLSRADFVLSPAPGPLDAPALLVLGDFEGTFAIIDELFGRWLLDPAGITRLAVGCQLLKQTPTLSSALTELLKYLPDYKLTGEVEDFFYQVNRPIQSSSAPGFKINRFVQWQQSRIGSMVLDARNTVISVTQPTLFAASCTMDINTLPETGRHLDIGVIKPLYTEMKLIARKLALEGDVP